MKAKNKYLLPVSKDAIKEPTFKSGAHVDGRKSDPPFGDEGTEVFAARDGEVVWMKDDSKEFGMGPKYTRKSNGVTIKHDGGEYTNYLHLRYKGVLVEKGQRVRKGDVIGYVGMSGWTPAPHLHFSVLRVIGPDPFVDYETLEFDVEDG